MYPDSPFAHPLSSFERPVIVPGVDVDALPQVWIPLNPDWLPYIAGALKQLLLQTTWIPDETNTLNLTQMRVFDLISLFNKATARMIQDVIKFRLLDCVIQVSYDAGATWSDLADINACIGEDISDGKLAPGNGSSGSPVTADAPWPSGSVPSGQDGACLTAANITDIWTQEWTQLEAGFSAGQTAIQLTAVLAGLVAVFIPVESVVYEFLALMDGLFAVGTGAFADLIASATTDVLQCAVFCHCAEDGSITATQFGAILADINSSSLNDLTKGVLHLWVQSQGPIGLMRMGNAAGVTSASCSCGCQVADLDVDVTALVPVYTPFNTTDGSNYEITFSGQFQVVEPGWSPEADCYGLYYYDNTGTLRWISSNGERSGEGTDTCPDYGPQVNNGTEWFYQDFSTRTDTHIYTFNYVGNGSPIGFQFQDCNYPGNSGTYHVRVKEV